MIPRFNFGK